MKRAVERRVQRRQPFEARLRGRRGGRGLVSALFRAVARRMIDALLITVIVITTVAVVSLLLALGALRVADVIGRRVREDATKLKGRLQPTRTLYPLSLVLGLASR